jgi:hypothetical protein
MADPTPNAPQSTLDYQNRAPSTFGNNGYIVDNMQFPKDLMGANSQYGSNYIVFYINVQTDSTISLNKGDSNQFIDPSITAKSSGAKSDIKNSKITPSEVILTTAVSSGVIGAAVGVGKAGLSPKAIGAAVTGAGVGAVVGGAVAGAVMLQTTTANRATKRLKTAIALHNPNMITVRYGMDWTGADVAKDAMIQLGVGTGLSGGSGISGMLKELKEAGGIAAGAVGNLALTNAPGKELLSAQSGLAANAKKEMIFKGVDSRSFTFDYKFAPRSYDEYVNAQNIIKMFKFHMHPEYVPGKGNYLYLYPSEFDILYYNNGNENMNLPRYASCVLSGMTVNYAPNGNFTAFVGGAPTQIDISLEFKELTTLTKAEIMDGY